VIFGPVTKNRYQRSLHVGFDQVSFHTERAVLLLNQAGRRRIL
jgi:hypothetical protein